MNPSESAQVALNAFTEMCHNSKQSLNHHDCTATLQALSESAFALAQIVRQIGNHSNTPEVARHLTVASATAWQLGQNLDAAYQNQC